MQTTTDRQISPARGIVVALYRGKVVTRQHDNVPQWPRRGREGSGPGPAGNRS